MNIKNVLKIFLQTDHKEVLYIIYISILRFSQQSRDFRKLKFCVLSLHNLFVLGGNSLASSHDFISFLMIIVSC